MDISVRMAVGGGEVYEIGHIEAADADEARVALADLLIAVADNLRSGFDVETVGYFHQRRQQVRR